MLTTQSNAQRENTEEAFKGGAIVDEKVTNGRSSLLVLSSSKDDEEDRIYSVCTAGGAGEAINTTEVVDPRTLIQFREMEQESFHLSRQGGPEQNLIQLQISGEEGDYSMINEEGVMKYSRRAGDHNLDGLSLDTSSLHASNLM